jgi:hypothetical protein
MVPAEADSGAATGFRRGQQIGRANYQCLAERLNHRSCMSTKEIMAYHDATALLLGGRSGV